MDLFSAVGSQEILMILLVAIIVIGPIKIVNFGKTLGKVTRNIKETANQLSANLNKEIELEEQEDKKKNDKIPLPNKAPSTKS